MSKLDEDDFCLENFPKFLERAGYGNEMLAIETTCGCVGHCPMYYTDVFGFDYCGRSQDTASK